MGWEMRGRGAEDKGGRLYGVGTEGVGGLYCGGEDS